MRLGKRPRLAGTARWSMVALLAATTFITSGSWPALAAGRQVTPAKGITAGDLILSLCSTATVAEYTPKGKFVQKLITFKDGLLAPTGSAFDKQDNLYVTDFGSNSIWKRTPQGKISVFSNQSILGNGHAYNSPESAALSKNGTKLYISNANRGGPGGGIDVVDVKTGKGVGFFPLPSSKGWKGKGESDWVGIDKFGHLFMTNESKKQGFMQVSMKTGDIISPTLIPNLPDYAYAFGFDKNGNVWLAVSTQVREYTAKGQLIRTVTSNLLEGFSAVFDPTASTFYVADLVTGAVDTFDLNGKLVSTFNVPFQQICGISVYRGFMP